MNYYINTKKIIEVGDVLEMLSSARSANHMNLLIRSCDLADDFFNLKSGIAGEFIQKFINYSFNVAILLNEKHLESDRFREMVLEANKQGGVCYFSSEVIAVKWLANL